MSKRTKKLSKVARPLLKLEALEQRQLLAGGFTTAQGTEYSNITAPNGNVYDQVLLKTSAITVTNDAGQITRVSFLDLEGDIVQAEFSGAGQLSISLAGFVGAASPTKYNQPDVKYVSGTASFTIQGSDATTNFSVFSVGTNNAHNKADNPIFKDAAGAALTGGNNYADVSRLTIVANPANPNGSAFGGIRAGNAVFAGSEGVVGITAAGVQVQDVVTVSNINASGTGTPTLIFGTNSQFGAVTVAGGGLLSANGKAINNTGSYGYGLTFAAGTTSAGTVDAAETTQSQLSFTGTNPIQAAVKNYNLTTGVDTITGSTADETFNGQIGGTATLTALDTLDGGAGADTVVINDVAGGTALPGGVSIKAIETLTFASAGAANIDTSTATITGLTAVNVTTSTGASAITLGSGQAGTVVNTAGTVTLTGGTSQTVTTSGGLVLSKATGAITATDKAQKAVDSTINGGTNVTVTTTGITTGKVDIGTTTAPTGTVMLTSTLTGDKAADQTAGAIAIKGGTTVTVAQTATQAAGTTTSYTETQGAVTVTGTTATTSVTVNQSAAVAKVDTVAAVAAVTETASVVFGALNAGDNITLGGLTYTAPTGGATAKAVAAAYANLSSAVLTGWSTAAVSGTSSDTVVFTSTGAGNVTSLEAEGTVDVTVTGTAPVVTTTNGTAAVTAAGTGGIGLGAVTIADSNGATATDTITSVTLWNYGNSTINSDVLSTLSLYGASGSLGITNTASKTLNLTVDTLSGANTITAPTYTTINITTATAKSTVADLVGAATTALSVGGTQALTFTTAAGLNALKTITVKDTAGLTISAGLSTATVTSVDASATSGAVTITPAFDATKATYAGGSGADTITIAAAPTKAIAGGAGTDRLNINATAATISNPSTNLNISGFETLGLVGAADGTYDATGFTGLWVGAITSGNPVTFSNVAAGATLQIAASPTVATTYTLKDATGTTDALAISIAGGATATVNAAGIETVSVAVTGTTGSTSLTLVDTAVTGMTLTGSRPLTLVNTGNTKLTSVDGSALTGALTYTAVGTVAETVKGGTAADVLTASTGTIADVLIGGAGNDTLTSNTGLTTLTGGDGVDTFIVATPGANVNTYTTITDPATGDVVRLADKGVERYGSSKVVLGSGTAVFQDYANTVVTNGADASTNGYIGWFQFNGDTYIIESMHDGTADPSFKNGVDIAVKLTGLVDLSVGSLLQSGANPIVIVR